MESIKILSVAKYLPPEKVTNTELCKVVDSDDEWIKSRTGIEERRFAKEITNAFMATEAAKKAMADADIKAENICCLLVATFTPDNFSPSVACEVQKNLCFPTSMMCVDINAACSGFIYGMQLACGILMQNPNKYALVIGSEKISPYLNFKDRTTSVLFGDGAGAAVLELRKDRDWFCFNGTRGDTDAIICRNSRSNPSESLIEMNGKEVFKFAVGVIEESIQKLLDLSHTSIDDIDHIVCHQANLRIISHVYKRMKIDPDKFFINLNKYGNTSAATIPIALSEMLEQGILKKNEKIICVGFGGGLTYGACLMTW